VKEVRTVVPGNW